MSRDFLRIEVEGLRELERSLKKLAPATQRRVLTNATRRGAVILRRAIKDKAPIRRTGGDQPLSPSSPSKGTRSPGFLKKSILFRRLRGRGQKSVTFLIGPEKWAYYAAFLEFGAPGSGIAPQPFVEPAARNATGQVSKEVATALGKGIIKEYNRLK